MLKMRKKEVLTHVIKGISKRLNKKALNEVLEMNKYQYDMNELLKAYYDRVHRMNNDRIFYEFLSVHDFDNISEFKTYIKENYNMKWYKKDYDYNINTLQPIKQKNTYFIIVKNNGFVSHASYLFNVYDFIDYNNIVIID